MTFSWATRGAPGCSHIPARATGARRLETALGRWNLSRRAFVEFDGHAQRASERLEDGLDLMVRVDAAQVVDMQRHARMVHEAAKEFDGEVDVEGADARTREGHVEFEARPAREIDHHARKRLVERHVGMAIAANALALADGFRHRLPERDARVFHRVVVVDMKIAMRFDLEIDQAVTRDLVEHVVEKRHAGGKLLPAGAVEIELHTDLRFAGVANDFRNAHGDSFKTLDYFRAARVSGPRSFARFLPPIQPSNARNWPAKGPFYSRS